MAGGQWEVVAGKSKRSKPKNGIPKPTKEKKKQDNAVVEPAAPISEAHTIYYAFMEKQQEEKNKEEKKKSKPVAVVEASKGKDKSSQQKKKKDKKNVAPTKLTLEQVYAQVTDLDLKNHLATLEVLYPNSPFIWLKDIASFLNIKLDTAPEDIIFSGKPLGYPATLLHKGVYKLMLKTFNRCSTQMLLLFYEHCLQGMVQDTLKGIHTLGYRTVLQCLAQEIPSIATANLPKCYELCQTHQNRQNICLSLLWTAGQAGNGNLEAGFKVWTDLMFPLIGTKTCTVFAVDYLEKLVCSEDLSKINKSIISVTDLFHILDFIYSKDLVKTVQKRLLSFYPTLKALSYGPEHETVLRNYFPSYLVRLQSQCPPLMREEILSSLVHCLEKDVRNYSIWRQLYTKHFHQSKILIAHLNEQWEKLPAKFPKRCLLDTLSVFQVTNEELLNSGKKEPVLQECVVVNKELLSKINSQMFSWSRVVLIFCLCFSLLLTFDILSHDSFIESHTGKLMKNAGLLVICAQAGEKLSYFYGKTCKLLETYVPIAALWTQRVLGPYFEMFWKQLLKISVYIWEWTASARLLCGNYLQPLLLKVDSEAPVYGRWILNMCKSLTVFLQSYLQSAFSHLYSSSESIVLWAQSSTVVESCLTSISQYSAAAIKTLQECGASLLQIFKSYIPT